MVLESVAILHGTVKEIPLMRVVYVFIYLNFVLCQQRYNIPDFRT